MRHRLYQASRITSYNVCYTKLLRINPRKNLATLVRAVAALKSRGIKVKLYAAGEASDAEYHQLVLKTISYNFV